MKGVLAQFPRIFLYWLPMAAVTTLLSGVVYAAVQQDLRLSANDPQIQMAEDSAVALANGRDPQSLVTADTVDIAKSLAPFLIVFDDTGQPIASSAQLDGQTPLPPAGVFTYTKQHGEDRFTWQPKSLVRSAAVITYFSGTRSGFVLAGRSLQEVENRIDGISTVLAILWAVSMVATFCLIALLVVATSLTRKSPNKT